MKYLFQDLKSLNDFEKINNLYRDIKNFTTLSFEVDDINNSFGLRVNIVATFINNIISHIKYKKNFEEHSKILRSIFSEDVICFLVINSDVRIEDRRFLSNIFNKLSIIESVRLSSWQVYYESLDKSNISYIFNKLDNLTRPFNDDRFRAIPISTSGYKKGLGNLESLKKEKGSINRYFENNQIILERDDSAYKSIYLDAKIGILFLFKDLPSMIVSFNVCENKNIYIHQIQCCLKDRGHYKLKNWKYDCINYIKDLFKESDVFILSGEDAINSIVDSYKKIEIKEMLPSESLLSRIKSNYDEMYNLSSYKIEKSNIKYSSLMS